MTQCTKGQEQTFAHQGDGVSRRTQAMRTIASDLGYANKPN